MQQLSALDAWFIDESDTQFQHICDILVFSNEGPGLTMAEVKEIVAQRIHLVPPMRRRLVEVPFGIDEPYWIEDPEFRLEHHLHEHVLPEPGNDGQLAETVARIQGSRLSRQRPLWELHLIHGLEGDRKALVKKFHHAAIDGGSGLEVTSILLDPTREPRTVEPPAEEWVPDPEPQADELMLRGFASAAQRPMRAFEAQQRMMKNMPKPGERTGGRGFFGPAGGGGFFGPMGGDDTTGDGGFLENPMRKVEPMPWNKKITADRAIAFGSVSLSDIKQMKNAFGATVNDTIVSVVAGALRGWLQERGVLPDKPLQVCIPISVRTEEQTGQLDNRVSILVANLPTHLADPVERLKAAHESMAVAKDDHNAIGANILADIGEFYMPALQARASRVTAGMDLPEDDLRWHISISNLPGSRVPLYLNGHELQAHYPIGMVQERQGMMITVASYLDNVGFGLICDPNLVPDIWDVHARCVAALEELKAAIPAE